MLAGAGNEWAASERLSSPSETRIDNACLGSQASEAEQADFKLPDQTGSPGKVEVHGERDIMPKPLVHTGGVRRLFKAPAVSGFQSASALADRDIEQAERLANTKPSREIAFQQSLPDSEVGSSGVGKSLRPCPLLGTQLMGRDLATQVTDGHHRKLQKMVTHLSTSSPQMSGMNGSTFAPCPDKPLCGPEKMRSAKPSLEDKESANCKMGSIPAYFPDSNEASPEHAEQVQSFRLSPTNWSFQTAAGPYLPCLLRRSDLMCQLKPAGHALLKLCSNSHFRENFNFVSTIQGCVPQATGLFAQCASVVWAQSDLNRFCHLQVEHSEADCRRYLSETLAELAAIHVTIRQGD